MNEWELKKKSTSEKADLSFQAPSSVGKGLMDVILVGESKIPAPGF